MKNIFPSITQNLKIIRCRYDNRSLILPFSLSRVTVSIAALIVISASFMRQIVDYIRNNLLGLEGLGIFILALVISSIVFLAVNLLRKKMSFLRLSSIIVMIALGFIGVMRLELSVEKMHILEYSVLGWFALADTVRTHSKVRGFIIAIVFCATVGIFDEVFQAILPYRFYDNRDIIFNVLGSLEGIILYLFIHGN